MKKFIIAFILFLPSIVFSQKEDDIGPKLKNGERIFFCQQYQSFLYDGSRNPISATDIKDTSISIIISGNETFLTVHKGPPPFEKASETIFLNSKRLNLPVLLLENIKILTSYWTAMTENKNECRVRILKYVREKKSEDEYKIYFDYENYTKCFIGHPVFDK